MKKLFFVTLLSMFMAFSSFAQSKVDRFLGNWNLTQAKDISKINSSEISSRNKKNNSKGFANTM